MKVSKDGDGRWSWGHSVEVESVLPLVLIYGDGISSLESPLGILQLQGVTPFLINLISRIVSLFEMNTTSYSPRIPLP